MIEFWPTRDDAALVRDSQDLYTQHFGVEPDGVWAAPGRVNLIGDHVDYAEGISIPFALAQNTAVAMAPRDDDRICAVSVIPGGKPVQGDISLSDVGPGNPSGWLGYVAGTIWALRITHGFNLAIVSDVPLGSGLSSSAALECSVALGAEELARSGSSIGGSPLSPDTESSSRTASAGSYPQSESTPDRDRLISAAITAENDVVGASTGGLDQRASLLGASGQALVLDFFSGDAHLVDCDFAAAGVSLLVANTNAPHSLSDGQYGSRRGLIDSVMTDVAEHGKHLRGLSVSEVMALVRNPDEVTRRRVRHVIGETQRTAQAAEMLARDDFDSFGQAMIASHESLRDDFEVVTPELESAFQAALTAGALGARMTGGGFGGSVIALVKEEDVTATAEAIAKAASSQGFPQPSFLIAQPSAGGRRLV